MFRAKDFEHSLPIKILGTDLPVLTGLKKNSQQAVEGEEKTAAFAAWIAVGHGGIGWLRLQES